MMLNIPDDYTQRVIIIGAGFAGLNLAKKLNDKGFQIVLIDKNNYHQFKPLLYQVAMAGLEPSSVSFPIRKVFQNKENIHIRNTNVTQINTNQNVITTSLGDLEYDQLVIATGATTNYFNNPSLASSTYSLSSIAGALTIRNAVFNDLELALGEQRYEERQGLIDIIIVGGGPTGVELAGAFAEIKNHIVAKDYPTLNTQEIDIYLIEAGPRILNGMSEKSGKKAHQYLTKLGIQVSLNKSVVSYDKEFVHTSAGEKIRANKVIWTAGIKGATLNGLDAYLSEKGARYQVDAFNKIIGLENVYAIGDIALMKTKDYPSGHPQVAQVAIQQANQLAKNMTNTNQQPFVYQDLGSMAIIGRNKAVCDIKKMKFSGLIAWLMWLFIHLVSLVGFKNKLIVLLNWFGNYITYDQSLRLIIKSEDKRKNSLD